MDGGDWSMTPAAPRFNEMFRVPTGMENFAGGGSIHPDMEGTLRSNPLKAFGMHKGFNFEGRVWWDGEKFCEAVYFGHHLKEVVKANSLQALMKAVNDKYGWR